jgi:hypothetical protein
MNKRESGEAIPAENTSSSERLPDAETAASGQTKGRHASRQRAGRDALNISISGNDNQVAPPGAGEDNAKWARRGVIIGALSLLIAVLGYLGVKVTGPWGPSAGSITPSSPAPTRPDVPASITFTPQRPDGCSRTYALAGKIGRLPASTASVWLLAELYADPAHGSPNALYFAKQRIIVGADGSFHVNIDANTEPGSRTGRFLLALADRDADAELQLQSDSDRAHDQRVTDGQRLRLPPGSQEIAGSADNAQRC